MNEAHKSLTSQEASILMSHHPRTEKDGAATGVDAICTYLPYPTGPRLNREELYQELSQLTHSVTRLGTYTLDRDSLYVNGECLCCSWGLQSHASLYRYTIYCADSAPRGILAMSGDIDIGMSQLEWYQGHLVGRDQGCCETSQNT